MKLKSNLSGLLCLARCPWNRGSVSSPRRFLYTRLTSVSFFKVYVLNRSLNFWNRALLDKITEVYTRSLWMRQTKSSSPEPSGYVLQNGCDLKPPPLSDCLAAESHRYLQKVWSTIKLNELPAFVHVADLKTISFTTGIGTHTSRVVLQPIENLLRSLDFH